MNATTTTETAYAYDGKGRRVRNNPVRNRDLDGHWCLFGWGTCDAKTPPPPKPPTPSAPVLTNSVSIAQGPQLPRSISASQQPQRGLTLGVGLAANADLRLPKIAGAEANGSALLPTSLAKTGEVSLGGVANYGATAYAGDHITGVPHQEEQPFVSGACDGAGVAGMIANTASEAQLAGPFQRISANVGGGAGTSVALSFDRSGNWVVQVSYGVALPDLSAWTVTTNTCAIGQGCK